MASFTINSKTFAVAKHPTGRSASQFAQKDDILIHGSEDMCKLTQGELNGLFKKTGASPTKTFPGGKGEMCEWLYVQLDGLATKGESRVKVPTMEVPMAAKTKKDAPEAAAPAKASKKAPAPAAAAPAKAPKAAKEAKAPKTAPAEGGESARRGRKSGFEGKRLFHTPKEDGPGADKRRHATSRRTANRAILAGAGAKGMLFEDYLTKGGHPGDLARDVKKGAVTVK